MIAYGWAQKDKGQEELLLFRSQYPDFEPQVWDALLHI